MTTTLYTVGDVSILTVEVRNELEALVDPTTLVVTARSELGVVVTFSLAAGTIVRLSLGVFRFELSITEAGAWRLSATTTGAATPAAETYAIRARAA